MVWLVSMLPMRRIEGQYHVSIWTHIALRAVLIKSCLWLKWGNVLICKPLRATLLRRMAVMALLISSSLSKAELTCTTSKSTGTQLNLQHNCEPQNQACGRHFEQDFMNIRTIFGINVTNLKTSLTWLSSSGPIPSPGMRVTVCLPPYFAGGG